MAYYEYECQKCRKTFTVKQTFSEHDRHPPVKCPECGGKQARQLISSVHVKTSKKS